MVAKIGNFFSLNVFPLQMYFLFLSINLIIFVRIMFQNKTLQFAKRILKYYVKASLNILCWSLDIFPGKQVKHMKIIIFLFNFLLICVVSITVRLPWWGWHLNLLSDSICFLGFNLVSSWKTPINLKPHKPEWRSVQDWVDERFMLSPPCLCFTHRSLRTWEWVWLMSAGQCL